MPFSFLKSPLLTECPHLFFDCTNEFFTTFLQVGVKVDMHKMRRRSHSLRRVFSLKMRGSEKHAAIHLQRWWRGRKPELRVDNPASGKDEAAKNQVCSRARYPAYNRPRLQVAASTMRHENSEALCLRNVTGVVVICGTECSLLGMKANRVDAKGGAWPPCAFQDEEKATGRDQQSYKFKTVSEQFVVILVGGRLIVSAS